MNKNVVQKLIGKKRNNIRLVNMFHFRKMKMFNTIGGIRQRYNGNW